MLGRQQHRLHRQDAVQIGPFSQGLTHPAGPSEGPGLATRWIIAILAPSLLPCVPVAAIMSFGEGSEAPFKVPHHSSTESTDGIHLISFGMTPSLCSLSLLPRVHPQIFFRIHHLPTVQKRPLSGQLGCILLLNITFYPGGTETECQELPRTKVIPFKDRVKQITSCLVEQASKGTEK